MIIWISSYPKSGNTWVRSFLSYYFSNESNFSFKHLSAIKKFPRKEIFEELDINYKNFNQIPANWIKMQKSINLSEKMIFLKTHNAMAKVNDFTFTDSKNTKGFIYLVRDPRDVLLSYASHLNKDIEDTFSIMTSDRSYEMLDVNSNIKMSLLGSWASNYKSWKNCSVANGLVIKYEDLVNDTEKNFRFILNYLSKLNDFKLDEDRLKKSINCTNFENLKNLELKEGFEESGSNFFFRKGKVGDWKNNLNPKIINKIEKIFKDEMLELGYL